MVILGWILYVLIQLVMVFFTALGWLLLIPFCLSHAWRPTISRFDKTRVIDEWEPIFPFINTVWGNPEDGVSGHFAKVWLNGETQGPYMPLPPFTLPMWQGKIFVWLYTSWRAYCWSAWRNSSDNLKYLFAWEDGPYKELPVFGKTWRFGWFRENGVKVPVL